MRPLNRTLLNREAKFLMQSCFWSSSHYWTTRKPGLKRGSKTGIKIAYSSSCEWFWFIFSKFHREAIEVFRSFKKGEAWFYQEPVNQHISFSAWCIHAKHFEMVMAQLRSLSEVEIEFVVPQSQQGLCVPKPFESMGLQFYEVRRLC